jgi:hypothetical protein
MLTKPVMPQGNPAATRPCVTLIQGCPRTVEPLLYIVPTWLGKQHFSEYPEGEGALALQATDSPQSHRAFKE